MMAFPLPNQRQGGDGLGPDCIAISIQHPWSVTWEYICIYIPPLTKKVMGGAYNIASWLYPWFKLLTSAFLHFTGAMEKSLEPTSSITFRSHSLSNSCFFLGGDCGTAGVEDTWRGIPKHPTHQRYHQRYRASQGASPSVVLKKNWGKIESRH